MTSTALIRTVPYDGFEIQASASLRGTMWYPAYKISRNGEVISPWRSPDIDGRGSEDSACDWGVTLAISDIDIGLKEIFS